MQDKVEFFIRMVLLRLRLSLLLSVRKWNANVLRRKHKFESEYRSVDATTAVKRKWETDVTGMYTALPPIRAQLLGWSFGNVLCA